LSILALSADLPAKPAGGNRSVSATRFRMLLFAKS